MRVKITCTGTGHADTRVVDAETGKDVPNCYGFDVSHRVGDAIPKARLYCHAPAIEFEGEAEVLTTPIPADDVVQLLKTIANHLKSMNVRNFPAAP
jgi:hypothetical protein